MPVLEILGGAASDRVVPGMLARAAASGRIVLAAWVDEAPAVLFGRYHATPDGVRARRRHTGGRAVPAGPEHVRLALALPHRSATESDDPSALRPEQAMNRCVRGLLDACRTFGADVHYPGRDVVTAGGNPIAWLSITEEERGVAIFEAGLAVGALSAPAPSVAAAVIAEAYRRRAWSAVEDLEIERLPATESPDLEWTIPPAADRTGTVPTMLGSLSAHVRVDDGRRLTEVRIAGDVIAPVATVRAIERSLVHVPALRGELERAVLAVLADPRRWVLGIHGPRDVAAAVMGALG